MDKSPIHWYLIYKPIILFTFYTVSSNIGMHIFNTFSVRCVSISGQMVSPLNSLFQINCDILFTVLCDRTQSFTTSVMYIGFYWFLIIIIIKYQIMYTEYLWYFPEISMFTLSLQLFSVMPELESTTLIISLLDMKIN